MWSGIARRFVALTLNRHRQNWCFFRVGIARPILRAYWGMIKRSCTVLTVIGLLLVAVHAHAGEIEPRAYVNTPVGINFLLAGYAYTDGGLSTPGSSPLKGAPSSPCTPRSWRTHGHSTCGANQGRWMSSCRIPNCQEERRSRVNPENVKSPG